MLPLKDKVNLIRNLCGMNPASIEIASFAEQLPPQLDDGEVICKAVFTDPCEEIIEAKKRNVKFCGYVPTMKGYERFAKTSLDMISVATSATDSHCRFINAGKDMKASLKQTCGIIKAAKADGKVVRAYVNMAFACPFEGDDVEEDRVMKIINEYKGSISSFCLH